MAISDNTTLKTYFQTGDVPTELQFIDLIDTTLPQTAKGDLVTYSTLPAILSVGANTYILTADSTTATGLKWVAPTSTGITIGTTAITGGATTQVLFNLAGVVSSNAGMTYVAGGLFKLISTTQQFSAQYDASNRLDLTVGSTGNATFSLTGTSPTFSFSQSVGIGTTSPGNLLHVEGTDTGSGIATFLSPSLASGGTMFVSFGKAAVANQRANWRYGYNTDATKQYMGFAFAGNSDVMSILGTGNVGIGTTTPSAKLHVISTTEQFRAGYDASNFLSTTIDISGNATFSLTGTLPEFSFTSTLGVFKSGINAQVKIGTSASIYNTIFCNSTGRITHDIVGGTTAQFQFNKYIGVMIAPTAQLTLGAGLQTAGGAPLKFTSQASPLTTVEQGTMELVGNSLQFSQLAKRRGVAMSQDVIITSTTVGNTLTESATFITASHGANYLEVGKMEEIRLTGTLQQTSSGGGILTIRTKYAGATILTTVTVTGDIAAGTPFEIITFATCRSTGVTGTLQVNSRLWIDGITNAPDAQALVTIDTTTAQDTTITAQWSVANASNTMTVQQGRVLCIEPNR